MNWFKSSRKKESEDYEKEFLSRYKKQQKAKPEKKASKHKKVIEIGKITNKKGVFINSKKIA